MLRILQVAGISNLILGIGAIIKVYGDKDPFYSSGKTIFYVAMDLIVFLIPLIGLIPFFLFAAYVLLESNRSNKSFWLVTFFSNVILLVGFQVFIFAELSHIKQNFGVMSLGVILTPIVAPVINIAILVFNMPKGTYSSSLSEAIENGNKEAN